MKIILITPPKTTSYEVETITQLFERGLDVVHIRKPKWSDEELESYVQSVPDIFWKKVALHRSITVAIKFHLGGIHQKSTASFDDIPKNWKGRKSRSAHNLEELEKYNSLYDYYFLSPVFDSISKKGYESNFDQRKLKNFLFKPRKYKVVALGGVEANNVYRCQQLGFDGLALLGSIWKYETVEERIKEFEKIALTLKGVGEI